MVKNVETLTPHLRLSARRAMIWLIAILSVVPTSLALICPCSIAGFSCACDECPQPAVHASTCTPCGCRVVPPSRSIGNMPVCPCPDNCPCYCHEDNRLFVAGQVSRFEPGNDLESTGFLTGITQLIDIRSRPEIRLGSPQAYTPSALERCATLSRFVL